MSIFEAIVLGIIQGLTEFIPVSSSGHLVIAQVFFSGASDHLFIQWIDLGTFLALIVYFRHKLAGIYIDITRNKNYRLARNMLLTAIPAGIVGLIFADFIATNAFFGSLTTVAVMLVVVGILMIVIERLPHASAVKDGAKLSIPRALMIGFAQIFALIPGTSRSGTTIIAGRFAGLNAEKAAEYSFLASLPIIGAVLLKLIVTPAGREYYAAHALTLTVANIAAFIAGLIAVKFLLNYLSKHSLAVFGWYRIVLATVLVVVLLVK